jgi:4-amino-4-deoxy-L-arabinose transferase-like glycosyltransferase
MKLENIVDWAVRHRHLFLTLAGTLLYIAFIGLRDVWYPDEPDIAEVALAMFQSGDWIAPRRMGVVWVDYPPMIYWIGVLSSHALGGMTAFALRLPNAMLAIATVLLTCSTASRWYDSKTGLWTGFALLTCLLFVYEANSYRPDVSFTLAITAGMISYANGTIGKLNHGLRVLQYALHRLAGENDSRRA